jgi:DNA-binding FadR family transcriptional regulator
MEMTKRDLEKLEESVAARWAKLGMMTAVAADRRTPDVERLLLDTVRVAGRNLRLLELALTWLVHYGDYVAKRRLALMVRDELEEEWRGVMGLLLESAQQASSRHRRRFREAIAFCERRKVAGPLADVSNQSAVLRNLAKSVASDISRKWGCWVEELRVRDELIRPAEWVARENASLGIRALCGGDLVATLAADSIGGAGDFASEAAMARRYGASRAAIRDALRKLTLAGVLRRWKEGKGRAVGSGVE